MSRPQASRSGSKLAESHPSVSEDESSSRGQRDGRCRVFIEGVDPELGGGRYAAKRVLGDSVSISVDLIADGHDIVTGELLVRRPRREGSVSSDAETVDSSVRLEPMQNDRFTARFEVTELGRWHYTFCAWVDHFATWQRGLARKLEAGQDVDIDLLIGAELLKSTAVRATREDRSALGAAADHLASTSVLGAQRGRAALSSVLTRLVAAYPDRATATRYDRWLPLWVDRQQARFSTWYELFPRSTGPAGQHGTFETALGQLPYIAAMGFDILYLPPIHPIGRTFRKGKNNSSTATESDVGSPWAIGSSEGGHKSVHPALGTLADFEKLTSAAARHGLEMALDIALQVTPDHPYVKEHPEWFRRRPDGSIQYAENPPKKYQDIYPFDFESEAWWSLWQELKSIFDFWIARGVRIFRVDNPHTKSLSFWEWCIDELTKNHPDLIFLAEAFTRPKLMYLLAKVGFTQSYTYFTWRNTGEELTEYLRELNTPPVRDFFRPNFWPATPDILPEHLQHAGRASFTLRLVLAATLSSNYGIYGPAFELMDNVPRAGVEESVDNEKYQLRTWEIERHDSLRAFITRINAIRRENTALQQGALSFHKADNPLLLCFSKRALDGSHSILVVANLDVHNPQLGWIDVDLEELGGGAFRDPAPPREALVAELQLHDLLSDARYFSQGRRMFVRLDPGTAPAHIFRIRRRTRKEHDFDYFM